MAWNIHWQMQFASFLGNAYTLNIYDNNYTGSIVSLTPAEDPFTTQETSNTDPFTAIRSSTGYIRIIVDNWNIVQQIAATSPLSRFVRLIKGTNNIVWQGFIQPKTFDQPTSQYIWQVEFPVKSVLAVMEDVDFVYNTYEGMTFLKDTNIIDLCFSILFDGSGITNYVQDKRFQTMGDGGIWMMPSPTEWTYQMEATLPDDAVSVRRSKGYYFFNVVETFVTEDVIIDGDNTYRKMSLGKVKDALEAVLKIECLTIYEEGNRYYFLLAGENKVWLEGTRPNVDIYSGLTIINDNQRLSHSKTYESVKITCQKEDSVYKLFIMPTTVVNGALVSKFTYSDSEYKIQIHNPSDRHSEEIFNYTKVEDVDIPGNTITTSISDFAYFRFASYKGIDAGIGAAPTAFIDYSGNLTSGVYVKPFKPEWRSLRGIGESSAYTVKAKIPPTCKQLCIYSELTLRSLIGFPGDAEHNNTTLYISIKNNGQYLNDAYGQWNSNRVLIPVTFSGDGKVITNIPNAWVNYNHFGNQGFYFTTEGRTGEVEISIVAGPELVLNTLEVYPRNYFPEFNLYNNFSEQEFENIYQKTNTNPASQDKSYTFKNFCNRFSNLSPSHMMAALQGANDTYYNFGYAYKWSFSVYDEETGTTTRYGIKPEEYLINKMAAYFFSPREILKIDSRTAVSRLNVYTLNGKSYIPIITKNTWVDDIQEVTFIEVLPEYTPTF